MPQLEYRRALKDLLAGAVFIGFGLAFALGALDYTLGSPLNMGPGYMPLALGLVTIALGILVGIEGLVLATDEPIGGVSGRSLILITAALLFFGLTVRGLGVAGALLGTAFLASLARRATPLWEAVAIAVGLTVVSVVIFIILLQLRLPLVGPWVPF